jgi:hypothetical protein
LALSLQSCIVVMGGGLKTTSLDGGESSFMKDGGAGFEL